MLRRLILAVMVAAVGLAPCAAATLERYVQAHCGACAEAGAAASGVFILDRGEQALLARAWLTDHAERSIDVQYFIWSTDNIGALASEALLRAADRGVRVRVLVDDFLLDADDDSLLAMDAHNNVEIRVYNPQHSVGISFLRRALNLVRDFRGANQRMHDKTAIFDRYVGITGGRNMADEYFDYNREYTFRDRDVLLVGPAVADMSKNFEEFWTHRLSRPVGELLGNRSLSEQRSEVVRAGLHRYAADPANFAPRVRRLLAGMEAALPQMIAALTWTAVEFLSDSPGKNAGDDGMAGGGASTQALVAALARAERRVLIQSPYLVLDPAALALFRTLVQRGVKVSIVTNSLASTDNLLAYSGYHKRRAELLAAGLEIFEYKPQPQVATALIEQELRGATPPIFALHAKSMLIDEHTLYIGSFNLDPRSANLNTEVGVLIAHAGLATELERSITLDMHAENSWRITADFNPDNNASLWSRLQVWFLSLLPLTPIL